MANNQQDQDRSEQATPFKLKEAKNRGQVNKSTEVNSLLSLVALLGVLYLVGESLIIGKLNLFKVLLSQADTYIFDVTHIMSLYEAIVSQLASLFWPMALALIFVGIASNVSQTGPIFTLFPIKPDIQRINPIAGFKRIFSMRLLFESLKSVIKFSLFAAVIYYFISKNIPELLGLMDTSPSIYASYLLDNTIELMAKLILAYLVIALLDLMYTRWDFAKQMRMSHRDIKDEVKRRDGDPLVKSKMRELQREAAKRSGSLKRVPDADVLITNPTHFSVAIKYERGVMLSPEVIAKGAGDLALKMRLVANRNNIPIIEHKYLARRLFKKVNIDETIPIELFPIVAKILVAVFSKHKSLTSIPKY